MAILLAILLANILANAYIWHLCWATTSSIIQPMHTPLDTDRHTPQTLTALTHVLALPHVHHVASIEDAVVHALVAAAYEPARVLMDALLSADACARCADVAVALVEQDDVALVH